MFLQNRGSLIDVEDRRMTGSLTNGDSIFGRVNYFSFRLQVNSTFVTWLACSTLGKAGLFPIVKTTRTCSSASTSILVAEIKGNVPA